MLLPLHSRRTTPLQIGSEHYCTIITGTRCLIEKDIDSHCRLPGPDEWCLVVTKASCLVKLLLEMHYRSFSCLAGDSPHLRPPSRACIGVVGEIDWLVSSSP